MQALIFHQAFPTCTFKAVHHVHRGTIDEHIYGKLLIIEGIKQTDKKVTYEIISKETEAIKHAISLAKEGSFITALSDVVTNAIEIVQSYLDKETEE